MAEIQDFNVSDPSNTARWPENMPFSNVNNAGRADEGILARWYKDTDGSITSSGSSNAFAITSNRTIAALFNNLVMAFTANFTITGAPTLNFNGLGAKSIKRFNSNDLAPGDIVSGQPIVVIYKSSPDIWFMMTAPAALTANTFADYSENASPGNPASDNARIYAKDDTGNTVMAYRDSAGSEAVLMGRATQAEMEGGVSGSLLRSAPIARQHFHPWHPKAAGLVDGTTGATITGTGFSSAGISTGTYQITLTTAMSSANYIVVATAMTSGSRAIGVTLDSATQFTIRTFISNTAAANNNTVSFAVFGDI